METVKKRTVCVQSCSCTPCVAAGLVQGQCYLTAGRERPLLWILFRRRHRPGLAGRRLSPPRESLVPSAMVKPTCTLEAPNQRSHHGDQHCNHAARRRPGAARARPFSTSPLGPLLTVVTVRFDAIAPPARSSFTPSLPCFSPRASRASDHGRQTRRCAIFPLPRLAILADALCSRVWLRNEARSFRQVMSCQHRVIARAPSRNSSVRTKPAQQRQASERQ